MKITRKELLNKWFEFFESKNHVRIKSASVIPENDPSVLFTTAGMHPLVPYLLGQPHPKGKRLCDVQKCIRTGDIDEVGDNCHLTFFACIQLQVLYQYFFVFEIPQIFLQYTHSFLSLHPTIPSFSRFFHISLFPYSYTLLCIFLQIFCHYNKQCVYKIKSVNTCQIIST